MLFFFLSQIKYLTFWKEFFMFNISRKNRPPSVQHRAAKWCYLETKNESESLWMKLYIPHYLLLFPYNIQRPFLKDWLWGFFSVNVILLQTSLWKCHPAPLFISSPALCSIIHHFPLEGSHTQGEALSEPDVQERDSESEATAVLHLPSLPQSLARSGVFVWCLLGRDHPLLKVLARFPCCIAAEEWTTVNHVCKRRESCNFSVFASISFEGYSLCSEATGRFERKHLDKNTNFLLLLFSSLKIYLGHKHEKAVVRLCRHKTFKSRKQIL